MERDELYQAIFMRKSVRSFSQEALSEQELAKVRSHLPEVEPAFPGIRTEFRVLAGQDVKGMIKAKAPHFLAIYSEEKDGYLTNAGFMMQQMDLFFSANGIGSCWQGMSKASKDETGADGLEFVIMMAFGKPAEGIHRKSTSEFKRDPLGKMVAGKADPSLLEPARLAPSAVNNQPWRFTVEDGAIDVNVAKSIFVERTNLISAGIALCHLWLAAVHAGRSPAIVTDRSDRAGTPKGYLYAGSLVLG